MSNVTINLPNNRKVGFNDLVNELKEDNIILLQPDQAKIDYLSDTYKSYLQRNIIANRYKDFTYLDKYHNTKLHDIISKEFIVDKLPDIEKSTAIILEVIKNNGKILILSDYDQDGIASAVVGYKMFKNLFKYDNIEIIVNKREHGNGINNILTNEVIQYPNIDLIITSDQASSDKKNLTRLKDKLGCKVIVTDHHLFLDEYAPFNMDAFVNPQRLDNELKDITGTHVLYYTLLHAFYTKDDYINEDDLNYIYYLLLYVGLTIISDCMDLKNYVNKKILNKVFIDLNSKHTKHDTFWEHVIKRLGNSNVIDETTLGYNLIPMINSTGRISDPRLGYELMISDDRYRTERLYDEAVIVNSRRKEKQNDSIGKKGNIEFTDGTIKVMYIEDSEGVQGIIANNIMYGEGYKIAICFTRATDEDGETILTGSGRSQDEHLSLKDVVDKVSIDTDLIKKFGGHKKAIGIKMKDDLEGFYNALKLEVDKHKVEEITNYYIDDYIYSVKKLVTNLVDSIDIGPYGIGFEKPTYSSDMYVESFRLTVKSKAFLMLKLRMNKHSKLVMTAFYNVKKDDVKYIDDLLVRTKFIRVVYNMSINSYMNYNKILLNIVNIQELKENT